MEDRKNSLQWWPVAFLFGFLAVVAIVVFVVARPPSGQQAAPAEPATPAGQAALSAEEFAQLLMQRQPSYSTIQLACPVEGALLNVPNQDMDNRLGGVATDLMKIALSPPEGSIGRPSFESQDWEMLLVTCPDCGATYHGIDLFNFNRGDAYSLADWDLAALAPALAVRPQAGWTTEERILGRVLTQRAAGVESIELGFSALQGAYAANFNTWYGREVNIPSPAFYALAAAFLHDGLAMNSEAMAPGTLAVTDMTLGEMYRLLGRMDDAGLYFRDARDRGGLDEYTLQVLTQLGNLAAEGDSGLHRAEVAELAPLSTGWYLDEMLPAINGHITAHRAGWADLNDPDEILAGILAALPVD